MAGPSRCGRCGPPTQMPTSLAASAARCSQGHQAGPGANAEDLFPFLELPASRSRSTRLTEHVVACWSIVNRPRGRPGRRCGSRPARPRSGFCSCGWRERKLAECLAVRPGRPGDYAASRPRWPRWGCGSTRRASWFWMTSSGTWAGSGKIHVRMGKGAPRVPVPASGMVPLINNGESDPAGERAGRVGALHGDDHTRPRGAAAALKSAPQEPGRGPAPGSAMRRCGPRSPPRSRFTCRTGGDGSPRTCCGTTAPASCMRTGWTWPRSRRSSVCSGSSTTMNYVRAPHPCRGRLGSPASSAPPGS